MPQSFIEALKESCDEYEDIPRVLLVVLFRSIPSNTDTTSRPRPQQSEHDLLQVWEAFLTPSVMRETKALFNNTYATLGSCYPWQASTPLAWEAWTAALCAAALQLPAFLQKSKDTGLSPLEHQEVVRQELRIRFVGLDEWDADTRYEEAFRIGRGLAHHVVAPVGPWESEIEEEEMCVVLDD